MAITNLGGLKLDETLEVTGVSTFVGASTGTKSPVTRGTTTTYAPTIADSGMVYVAMLGSGTQTYTLPAVATAGVTFTFICGHASGEILVTTASTDPLVITSFATVGVDADTAITTVTSGIKNTAATNAIGDALTIVSDGTTWLGKGMASGIWASQ